MRMRFILKEYTVVESKKPWWNFWNKPENTITEVLVSSIQQTLEFGRDFTKMQEIICSVLYDLHAAHSMDMKYASQIIRSLYKDRQTTIEVCVGDSKKILKIEPIV